MKYAITNNKLRDDLWKKTGESFWYNVFRHQLPKHIEEHLMWDIRESVDTPLEIEFQRSW